jgi:hypothetical protein
MAIDHFSGNVMQQVLTQPQSTLAPAVRAGRERCAATAPVPPGGGGHDEGRGRRRTRADSDFGTHR